MSKIAITPNASGTATFTISAPATNVNQTLTLPNSSTTLVGTDATQTLTNKTFTGFTETVFTIQDATTVDLNPANGTIQIWKLTGNRTPYANSFANGQSMTIMIDDVNANTVTWSTINVTWVGGSAPSLPTTGYGVIELWKANGIIYGASVGNV